MSISKISGVLWDNISKLLGVDKSSIIKVGNISASVSVTCTEINLAFGRDGRTACSEIPTTYYLDESTANILSRGTLYTLCGEELAPEGFYSDGAQYWQWDGTSLSLIGECRR
jgi:hypothetical protein